MSSIQREVLRSFKNLHRARKIAFEGDENALHLARNKINDEYKKNMAIDNDDEIKKLVKLAKDIEVEIRQNVIQAKEKEPGVYELRITEDTKKLDNVLFDVNAKIPTPRSKKCKDV